MIEDKPYDYSLDSDNDDEYDIDEDMQRFGDDFEVTELVRYEGEIKKVLKRYVKYTKSQPDKMIIFKMHFDCIKHDTSVMITNGKYSEGWLYVVHIVMLINDDVVDYTNMSHKIAKHYDNEQHILGINGKKIEID